MATKTSPKKKDTTLTEDNMYASVDNLSSYCLKNDLRFTIDRNSITVEDYNKDGWATEEIGSWGIHEFRNEYKSALHKTDLVRICNNISDEGEVSDENLAKLKSLLS